MQQKIRKAVIPVAGIGTRFLPATKAQPKEMLPVVDKPIVQYVVEEAVASGITDIILVTGASKRAIEDHFDNNSELSRMLIEQGKTELNKQIEVISKLANFIYVRQKGPYGNGTAVLCAKDIVGNEPFAMLWGDEFFYCPKKPRLKQLIDVYEKYGDPVLTAYKTNKEGTKKYGIIKGTKVEANVYQISDIVEKPGPKKTPSLIASLGGFIFTPDIFYELEQTKIGKGRELWLVDAVFSLGQKRPLYGCVIDGTYYDTGSKIGYLQANIDEALRRPDLKGDLRRYLRKISSSL
jgi:UTP--glucose-1-phosphate uridylyltransferase